MNFFIKIFLVHAKRKTPGKIAERFLSFKAFTFWAKVFHSQDAVLLFLPHVLQSFDANKSYTFSVFPVAKE